MKEKDIDIGFQILHLLFVQTYFLKKEIEERIKEIHLSETEARIIFFLGISGGVRKMSELRSFIQKHKSTLRQHVKKLEEKNIIYLEREVGDQREKKVFFTSYGKKFFRDILDFNREYQKSIFQDFSQKNLKTFLSFLKKMRIKHK